MNTLNFNQTGGFPITTDVLGNMQNSYSIFNQFCNLISGNPSKKYIIVGCENVGNTVTNGFVCIGNEILPFKGGAKRTYVNIKETITTRAFEDGSKKTVDKIREVVFGGNQYKWEDFKRVQDMEELFNNVLNIQEQNQQFVQKFEIIYDNINIIKNSLGYLNNIVGSGLTAFTNSNSYGALIINSTGFLNVFEWEKKMLFKLTTKLTTSSSGLPQGFSLSIHCGNGEMEEDLYRADAFSEGVCVGYLYNETGGLVDTINLKLEFPGHFVITKTDLKNTFTGTFRLDLEKQFNLNI